MLHDDKRPQVDVIWWDAHSFYVRCPYCEGIHRHALNSFSSGSRTSHCGEGGSYRYYFPVNERTRQVAYEIDKQKARFVNICTLQDLDEDSDEEEELANEFSSKTTISGDSTESASDVNMYEAAQEVITKLDDGQTYEEKSIVFAISDCVMGRYPQIQKFLRDSPDALIFLQGRSGNGDTTLIMASREESLVMVSLLLDHGSNVNAVNKEGRSALMEAALWGRLDNVKLLMNGGADKSLCDYEKHRAADLAQPTRKNQLERLLTAGGSGGISRCEPIYKEDTFNRDADRREIVRLLVGDDVKSKTGYGSPPTISEYKDYSFRRSPNDQSIVFRGPIANYPVTSDYKTVARLERGGQFPIIAAMSGWVHHDERPSIRISGRYWTDEVIRIAAVIGHDLTQDFRDHGSPGRFHASHAEKQLIAYFIDRHVFLPRDRVPKAELEASITRVEDQLMDRSCSSVLIRQLRGLERAKEEFDRELLNEDDTLLEDEYDEKRVKQLKADIQSVKKQLADLEVHAEVKEIRELEYQLRTFQRKEALHQKLIDISKTPPPISLTNPVILISSRSSEICGDCRLFKDQVNRSLGLSIELFECTEAEREEA
ncbi:MAG: hypothetical protein M1813_006346 [Trichoglossum hirsutum]|nr:MAG: hypothetical protein M1813_006346 [Trichoglossum hirsutum]